MLGADTSGKLLQSLQAFIVFMANGKASQEVQPFFAGATLTALDKKNGADVRPIAVGETLRRVVSKCLCAKVKSDARNFFTPYQFG